MHRTKASPSRDQFDRVGVFQRQGRSARWTTPTHSSCRTRCVRRPVPPAGGVKVTAGWTALFEIERAEDQPVFNQAGLSGVWAFGARVLAFGPAFSVGVDNGHGPGRTCDPDRSRHYETALSSSESDDTVCQGA